VTRNHGYMVFDTLYGQTGHEYGFKATPQMAAGHVIEPPATARQWLGGMVWLADDPKIEELREAWFNARDREVQKKICREIQLQAFRNVPYYPLGAAWLARFPQGYSGVRKGFVKFWNVRRT
jgi:hypothetical protein